MSEQQGGNVASNGSNSAQQGGNEANDINSAQQGGNEANDIDSAQQGGNEANDIDSAQQGGNVASGGSNSAHQQGGNVASGGSNSAHQQGGNVTSGGSNSAHQQGGNVASGGSNSAHQQGGNVTSGGSNSAHQQGGNVASGGSNSAHQQGGNVASGGSNRAHQQGGNVASGGSNSAQRGSTSTDNAQQATLKKLRTSQAASLTRYVNKGLKGMSANRSRAYLAECYDNIDHALDNLSETNASYLQSLDQQTQAQDILKGNGWFVAREEVATMVKLQLKDKLADLRIPSVTRESHLSDEELSSSSGNTERGSSKLNIDPQAQKLRTDVKTAQLELQQTIRRANALEEETQVKHTQELLRIKQESRDAIEHAELKATALQEIYESSIQGERPASFKQEEQPPDLGIGLGNLPRESKRQQVGQWIENSLHSHSPHSVRQNVAAVQQSTLNPRADPWEPHPACEAPSSLHLPPRPIDAWIDELVPGEETVVQQLQPVAHGDNQIAAALLRIESERDLPQTKLPVFDGSALLWPRFIECFYNLVHCKPISDNRRMDLLQSHLSGEAKHLVEGIGYSGRFYAIALQDLKRHFGHRNRVVRAHLNSVMKGPTVQSRNPTALRQFCVAVRDCIVTLTQLQYFADLKASDVLTQAAQRIPVDRAGSWNKYVTRISRQREPALYDLRDWLDECIMADFNPYAVHIDRNSSTGGAKTKDGDAGHHSNAKFTKRLNKEKPHGGTVMNTVKAPAKNKSTTSNAKQVAERNDAGVTPKSKSSGVSTGSASCPLCSNTAGHQLYRCQQFRDKTPEERWKVVLEHKRCFNCLKSAHHCKSCMSTVNCKESGCNQRHHTLLHEGSVSKVANVNNMLQDKATELRDVSQESCLPLVEVLVYGNNGRTLKTTALLDSASDITLIKSDLAKELGLKGQGRQLRIKTVNSGSSEASKLVSFKITSADRVHTPWVTVREAWTIQTQSINCPPQRIRYEWQHLQDLGLSDIESHEVQILLGVNVPEVHLQLESRRGLEDQPVAVRTMLGWSLMGVASSEDHADGCQFHVNHIMQQEAQLQDQIKKFWATESFGVAYTSKSESSTEDRRSQQILDSKTIMEDGHYVVPMLWRRQDVKLPNNRGVAQRRFDLLVKRLIKDSERRKLYSEMMNTYIEKGYARKLTQDEAEHTSEKTWYLPHHGVVSPHKPGKVRIVFDAAAMYKDTSLNDNLMSGPDLMNSLFGVLIRFRLYDTAIAADIEAMFHQVGVLPEDTDSLRFLWKEDVTAPGPPSVFAMQSHIFGAKDSPSCSNYALQRTALDNRDQFSSLATETVLQSFYVDDLIKSVEGVHTATSLMKEVIKLLGQGGFHLHKVMSNSKAVLEALEEKELAATLQGLDLAQESLPVQRTLGLRWDAEKDIFIFETTLKTTEAPPTKRGVVSAVASIFDPCGFLAPYIMKAKVFIQELWRSGLGWDDSLSTEQEKAWKRWTEDLKSLQLFKLPRHHKGFASAVMDIEVHLFCDASEVCFGAVGYIRYTTPDNQVIVSLLAARTHVAPLKPALSMPRLELQGAVMAVRLGSMLLKELSPTPTVSRTMYWTDSTTVLKYLASEARRFKPFVSNRVAEIGELSTVEQWRYVPTSLNPADCCTRGMNVAELVQSKWYEGPEFLREDETKWPVLESSQSVEEKLQDDPEYKGKRVTGTVLLTTVDTSKPPLLLHSLKPLINPAEFSSWQRLVRRTAWLLRAVKNFMAGTPRFGQKRVTSGFLTAAEYEEATIQLVREAQADGFQEELHTLRGNEQLSTKSQIAPLSPLYDERSGCLRVGGRLRKAKVPQATKYQLLLPTDHAVTNLICQDLHQRQAHCGREHLIAEVRRKFWPVRARNVARRTISQCLHCRKQRVKPATARMADLPSCRLSVQSGAFYHTGVDYFGPMQVKIRRSSVKRWGCLFTCMGTRAIHLELADSLETDDFLLCLRSFMGRRGHPKAMYSDNGTNFVGANAELKECLRKLDESKIADLLSPHGIEWHFNPPQAPHFGGAWERLVKSVKTALNATLAGQHLTESVLRTALIEVEAVLNGRPLTHNSVDPEDCTALTPNHFLIGRAENQSVPVYVEDREINSRRRWRQVQVVANQVCRRWLREYLPSLTARSRWLHQGQSVRVGDLVLLVDENLPRGSWDLARIVQLFPGDDGVTRTVKLKTAKTSYVRPITRICVLEENVE